MGQFCKSNAGFGATFFRQGEWQHPMKINHKRMN
jgi:hypothetical protein